MKARLLIQWRYLPFSALNASTLYAVLQLRSEVFVVEQACAFQDLDGADAAAMHLLGEVDGELQAYARCLPPGLSFTEASIGRVVTRHSVRGSGAGHQLMQEAIARLFGQGGVQPIRIGAQAHLQDFYRQHGFVAEGPGYVEDGIAHVEMLRAAVPAVPVASALPGVVTSSEFS
jgi:ElaA protein